MNIDIKAIGVIMIALAIGFTAGRLTAPQMAVGPAEAFKSFDHCLAYYIERVQASGMDSGIARICRNLAP
ncbi:MULTISPECIES: hypothetical protein [Halomonadaceae]|uniref:hypothetical protein n=1 Tax=Halomonadaceae TaxID=28256 RepID=UPI001598AC3F|nr:MULTISPECIES: hypothetical protein [Halomonas]QJQ93942.1 hypothetical protein HIO72_00610 [Halomonas sp. PA5]